MDKVAKQLARHPFLAFAISALIISVTLPFIIFLVFAIATVILTFFGFVIVEGKTRHEFFEEIENIFACLPYSRYTHNDSISVAVWFSRIGGHTVHSIRLGSHGRIFWLHANLRVGLSAKFVHKIPTTIPSHS